MALSGTISEEVLRDWFRFMPENYWKDNAAKEVISTETVSEASTVAIDTNIKMNGRDDGIRAYDMVVELLLDYYYS